MARALRFSGQTGRVNAFCEIRASGIHGKGVFATRTIRRGARILEYVGELISKREANRRGLALLEQARGNGGPAVYIFSLNARFDIDGNKPWNPARLVNHACDPNCEMLNVDDRLFLHALRDIARGEELSFDYGYALEHFRDHPCRCGSPRCIGYIVADVHRRRLRQMLSRRLHTPVAHA
jgi:hypothetical protein